MIKRRCGFPGQRDPQCPQNKNPGWTPSSSPCETGRIGALLSRDYHFMSGDPLSYGLIEKSGNRGNTDLSTCEYSLSLPGKTGPQWDSCGKPFPTCRRP